MTRTVKVTSLRPVAGRKNQFQNIVIGCDQGDFTTSYAWYKAAMSKNNRFAWSATSGNFTSKVNGHFANKGKRPSEPSVPVGSSMLAIRIARYGDRSLEWPTG